jgi:predicted cupin superfamily sugar epimerase
MAVPKAADIIRRLRLTPHPEGGHYRETWRAPAQPGERASGTAIYYLLSAGERSHWHKVDAAEIWHWYAGAPLELRMSAEAGQVITLQLGNRLESGQSPQLVVPAHHWQSAASLGEWSLVGCTVSPGFEFEGFTMAPPDWQPAGA